jgi:hypothetical protein
MDASACVEFGQQSRLAFAGVSQLTVRVLILTRDETGPFAAELP